MRNMKASMERELRMGDIVATTWIGKDFLGWIISDKNDDGRFDLQEIGGPLVIRKSSKELHPLF